MSEQTLPEISVKEYAEKFVEVEESKEEALEDGAGLIRTSRAPLTTGFFDALGLLPATASLEVVIELKVFSFLPKIH